MDKKKTSFEKKLVKIVFGIELQDGQNTLKEITKVILQVAVIVLSIHTFFYKPFVIPSQSMVPTLLVGDYVFVSKFKYGFSNYSFPFSPSLFEGRLLDNAFFTSKPDYGDVAVFRPPHKPDEDWVKRIVGLPGDRVQMIKGCLHVNGKRLDLKPAGKYQWRDQNGQDFTSDLYIETLPNGKMHPIIKTIPFGQASRDDTPVYTVPEGHYFMVGDDRDFSGDSRYIEKVGFIPYDNLVGEAQLIFFSTELPTIGGAWWQFWKWLTATRYSRTMTLIK